MIFWPIIPSLNTETFPRSEGRGQARKKPDILEARMPRFAGIFFLLISQGILDKKNLPKEVQVRVGGKNKYIHTLLIFCT